MPADFGIVGDVEVVELAAVVIADESGHLLEAVGVEVDHGGGAVAVRLLSARHERLAEEAADGLAAVEAQVPGTLGEAEELLGVRRAEPLEVERQSGAVEILALGRRRKLVRREG